MDIWRRLPVIALVLLAGCKLSGASPTPPVAPSRAADPYREVTEKAGIRYHLEPATRPMRILESVGSGCAFFDYDNDGWQDILLVGPPRCALYHNEHNGTFRDATAGSGLEAEGTWVGCAVGDYDNDGLSDVLLTGYRVRGLFRNLGGGRFQDVTAKAGIANTPWSTAAAFADFDRDGFLDLYIGEYVDFGPHSKQYCNLLGKGIMTSCRPFDYDPIRGNCYRNRGNGTFEDVTQRWGLDRAHGRNLGVSVADFNKDGWPDFYLANDEIEGDLFENQQGHGFKNVGTSTGTAVGPEGLRMGGMGADWGDYDGDGWMDLLVGTFEAESKPLFRNREGAGFESVSRDVHILVPSLPLVVWGLLLFDYDHDGRLDLLFAAGHTYDNIGKVQPTSLYRQSAQLYHNEGRLFKPQDSPSLQVPMSARGLACGDYDNDGNLDLLMVDRDGSARLLHNEGSPNHWVQLALRGKKSNRDALGAVVTLRTGSRQLYTEVRSARSYVSACDPRVNFGLGSDARVDGLDVKWPSGAVTHLKSVPVDRNLTLTEGDNEAVVAH